MWLPSTLCALLTVRSLKRCGYYLRVAGGTAGSLVFISYSSRDEEEASSLARELQEHEATRVWFAPLSVRVGETYASSIASAVTGAAAVVLLLSLESMRSCHVKREIALAIDHGIMLLPFALQRQVLADLTPDWDYWLKTVQVRQWSGAQAACSAIVPMLPRQVALPQAIRGTGPSRIGESALRSALIQSATARESVSRTIRRCARIGIEEPDVLASIAALRKSGLLAFDEPLSLDTVLGLQK